MERLKKKLTKKSRPRVLDLFAGAGGLSEGFIKAGCEIVGHIEMDKKACDTIRTRMIYHALMNKGLVNEYKKYVLGDINRDSLIEKYRLQKESDSVICSKIDEHNYKDLIEEIKKRLGGGKLDMIIGGPPCQAYSHIGRARDDQNMRWDRRKFLYRYYVEFLKALNPKIFVFENVPGLITSGKGKYLKDMQGLMQEAGYNTGYQVLNAADFGVPQNRKRVILVGWNDKSKMKEYPTFKKINRDYLVNDFFSDLPKIQAGEEIKLGKKLITNKLLNKLGITNDVFELLMDHISRPNNKQDLEIYKLAVSAKQNGKNIKYNQLPKYLKTHNKNDGFFDRFKVIDGNAGSASRFV
jgi:DNA (cytosine-5)-methyltransferase 1